MSTGNLEELAMFNGWKGFLHEIVYFGKLKFIKESIQPCRGTVSAPALLRDGMIYRAGGATPPLQESR